MPSSAALDLYVLPVGELAAQSTFPHTTTDPAAVVVRFSDGAPETGLEGEFFADAGVAASCAPVQRETFIACQQEPVGVQDTVIADPPAVTVPTHKPT
jgi:hypothetical protein